MASQLVIDPFLYRPLGCIAQRMSIRSMVQQSISCKGLNLSLNHPSDRDWKNLIAPVRTWFLVSGSWFPV
jgi:hypothetical protein